MKILQIDWRTLPASEMILADSQASCARRLFVIPLTAKLRIRGRDGVKERVCPWMARKREKERPSPEDCLVAFKAERKARHVGDRCIVTRTNEIPFAREHEADEEGTPKRSWSHVTRSGHTNEVRSHRSSRSRRHSRVSTIPFPSSGSFQPAGWTRTVGRSHASATRLRAAQKPPSCTLYACRSEVVSYNTHARASR